eukprot:13555897-Ditylum_brightwellii.AAC.1
MQQQQKKELIESGHAVTVSKKERSGQQSSMTWTVIDDIHEDNEDFGVWPGNWQDQLKKINIKAKLDNTMK